MCCACCWICHFPHFFLIFFLSYKTVLQYDETSMRFVDLRMHSGWNIIHTHTLHITKCVYYQSLTLSIQIDGSFLYGKISAQHWTIFNFLNDNKMLTGALSPSLFLASSFLFLLLVFVIICIPKEGEREKKKSKRNAK